jgi:hypothetical protein
LARLDQLAKAQALAGLLVKVEDFQFQLGRQVLSPEKTLLDINHALGLAEQAGSTAPRRRARAELLARLLRAQGQDRPWGGLEVAGLLKLKLEQDLAYLQETLYAGAEKMAASWPLPPGLNFRRRIFRGLARRSFERYRARLLG